MAILRKTLCQLASLRFSDWALVRVRAENGSELGAGAAAKDRDKTGAKAEAGTTTGAKDGAEPGAQTGTKAGAGAKIRVEAGVGAEYGAGAEPMGLGLNLNYRGPQKAW